MSCRILRRSAYGALIEASKRIEIMPTIVPPAHESIVESTESQDSFQRPKMVSPLIPRASGRDRGPRLDDWGLEGIS